MKSQPERLLEAWITLSGIIKNSRITKGLSYNESVVMNLLYSRYLNDKEGIVSVKDIIKRTKMLKSLVNRTINSLENKEYLIRCEASGDKRMVYVKCNEEKLEDFLKVHSSSLNLAENIINIIGYDDAESFVKIVKKIENAGFNL